MEKDYDPKKIEEKWYNRWVETGLFHGDPDREGVPYCIVIPPPNVTGMLTLGHVLNNTLQDILIRWEKMRGRETCWVPGTDHAGIATQSKVEEFLWKTEQVSRYDLGREAFLERVWQWREKYGGTIIRQLRRLGAACDWERERFTLDSDLSKAVQEVFIRLYEKGLIYKGHRIINWCPKARTALSDEEVIYREEKGKLWYLRYPLSEGSEHITVATTRPETMLGDTAVAVHPDDPRYKDLIGRIVVLPLVNREIPIIADTLVDLELGTGAVKVTPAHDPNDYEIGLRHGLSMVNVMNDDGTMNAEAGPEFESLDRYECRKKVVQRLEELGLLEKIEDRIHQVGYSERGNVPVEPRLSEQWFVKMKPLAEPALKAVLDGRVRFHPQHWVKTYQHWMENIKDWCISRQLWWGHRIPVYYCIDCGHIAVSHAAPENCPQCNGKKFRQEEDVLDTWFSSWLWPFSVFGWPEKSRDLEHFYPTQTLVTGPDIIFFWVARMIMAGLEFMGDVPFSDVYFTPIIRDKLGRKLSKSLNNSPDPIDVMDLYGTDSFRFTMTFIAPAGQDIRYSNESCEIGRNFGTKIWNAARFLKARSDQVSAGFVRQLPDYGVPGRSEKREQTTDKPLFDAELLSPDDKHIILRLQEAITACTQSLDRFRFNEAAHVLYEFVWHQYCDWYVEYSKCVLYGSDTSRGEHLLRVMYYVFSNALRLLHPFMPFITEELWHVMGYSECHVIRQPPDKWPLGPEGRRGGVRNMEKKGGKDRFSSIMTAPWPQPVDEETLKRWGIDEDAVQYVEDKHDLIRVGRSLRSDYDIQPSKEIEYLIKPGGCRAAERLVADCESIKALLKAESLKIDMTLAPDKPTPSGVSKLGTIYMPLEGLVDIEAEKSRLSAQLQKVTKEIQRVSSKLRNMDFIKKAPKDVVEKQDVRKRELQEKSEKLKKLIGMLAG